ncbi:CDP-glycerol glycerophosphotransferase family protein [Psychroserpens sp.]
MLNSLFESHFLLKCILAPIIRIIDFLVPKRTNQWGFAVHHIKSDQFIENARAVFEEVKKDSTIKKILFTRDDNTEFFIEDAVNFELVSIKSFKGLKMIVQCGVLFVTHSISMDYSLRYGKSKFTVLKLNMNKRAVVNLWHGIPIKKLYALWNPLVRKRLDRVKFRRYERTKYAGLLASSDVDSYAMATMFYPIKHENVWATGLPRNDFLVKDYKVLPTYLKTYVDAVKAVKGDKKLVIYAPTYRQTSAVSDSQYYQFTQQDIDVLKGILKANNAILGIRLHYFRNAETLFNIEEFIDDDLIFDLGHNVSPEIAPVIREADVVISDYSSVFLEAIYINKPVISFAYDLEHYKNEQDGVLYDLEMVFPGPIVKETHALFSAVENYLHDDNVDEKPERYKFSQQFFYKHLDESNSVRVVNKIKNSLNIS